MELIQGFQSVPTKIWNLPPGDSNERQELLKLLSRLVKDCTSMKIASAYLSDSKEYVLEVGDPVLSRLLSDHSHKISVLQVNCNPNISVSTAERLVENFGPKLRVVTTGMFGSAAHHKEIIFVLEDRIVQFTGSMNFTRNGLCKNGETVTVFDYVGREEDEVDSVFDLYEDTPQFLFDTSHNFAEWLKFITKIERREKAAKDALTQRPDPDIITQQTLCHKTLDRLFSEINTGSPFERFIQQVQDIEESHPDALAVRIKASRYLREKMINVRNLDMSVEQDQAILRQLIGKLRGGNGIEYGALGVINFTRILQPKGESALNLYKDLVVAVCERDIDRACAVYQRISKEKGWKSDAVPIGLFSRISSIAFPAQCFTYNGKAKTGIDYLLMNKISGGKKLPQNSKAALIAYYEACDKITGAPFMRDRKPELSEELSVAPMHYLDLLLYNA